MRIDENNFKQPNRVVVYRYWFNGWKPINISSYEEFEQYIKKRRLTFNKQLHDLTFFGGDSFEYLDNCGHTNIFRITNYSFCEVTQREFVVEYEMCNGWDLITMCPTTIKEYEEWLTKAFISWQKIETNEENTYYLIKHVNKKGKEEIKLHRINFYLK